MGLVTLRKWYYVTQRVPCHNISRNLYDVSNSSLVIRHIYIFSIPLSTLPS